MICEERDKISPVPRITTSEGGKISTTKTDLHQLVPVSVPHDQPSDDSEETGEKEKEEEEGLAILLLVSSATRSTVQAHQSEIERVLL